ncbi:MAG: hypothetical protein ACOCUV_00750 [bacterium]
MLDAKKGYIAIAANSNQLIEAYIFLSEITNGLYKYGASDFSKQKLRANDYIMWEKLKKLRRLYTDLKFGQTDCDNEGLKRFKKRFSPESTQYVMYDIVHGRFIDDNTGASLPKIANAVLRKLPIFISRLIGEWKYNYAA